jgi:hypothetical protein
MSTYLRRGSDSPTPCLLMRIFSRRVVCIPNGGIIILDVIESLIIISTAFDLSIATKTHRMIRLAYVDILLEPHEQIRVRDPR